MPPPKRLLSHSSSTADAATPLLANRLRAGLMLIAVLCIGSQLHSYLQLKSLDVENDLVVAANKDTRLMSVTVEEAEKLQQWRDSQKKSDNVVPVSKETKTAKDSDNQKKSDSQQPVATKTIPDNGNQDNGKQRKSDSVAPRPQYLAPAHEAYLDTEETAIRRWGCTPRNETPFIFVHIGKAGGGGVRSRMAAAATDYNRSGWHRTHEDPNYYYPIYDERGIMHKAKFHTSNLPSWVPKELPQFHGDFDYEGYGWCSAATPLGMSIACANEQYPDFCKDQDNDTISDNRCDMIYMGHNTIGTEWHWLKTSYIVEWWNNSPWGRKPENKFIAEAIHDRHKKITEKWMVQPEVKKIVGEDNIPQVWCSPGPYHYRQLQRNYDKCHKPKEAVMDKVYHHVMGDDPLQAARMTASLPTLRVTVLREPFSWLMSKFFWHKKHYSRNNTVVAPWEGKFWMHKRKEADEKKGKETPPFIKCDDIDEAAEGWVTNRALTYLFYLCGEHCIGAWAAGTLSLEDLERQSAYNLRNSFVAVGLLQKTDEFYQMVKERVHYMDTSRNPEVGGKKHGSSVHPEATRCKEIFKNTTFQEELMSKSPALQALNRIYNLAIEVNEFQKQELAECGHPIIDVSSTA